MLAASNLTVMGPMATIAQALQSNGGGSGSQNNDNNTRTPIKHAIVIIGENRTFDHVFATYIPRRGVRR